MAKMDRKLVAKSQQYEVAYFARKHRHRRGRCPRHLTAGWPQPGEGERAGGGGQEAGCVEPPAQARPRLRLPRPPSGAVRMPPQRSRKLSWTSPCPSFSSSLALAAGAAVPPCPSQRPWPPYPHLWRLSPRPWRHPWRLSRRPSPHPLPLCRLPAALSWPHRRPLGSLLASLAAWSAAFFAASAAFLAASAAALTSGVFRALARASAAFASAASSAASPADQQPLPAVRLPTEPVAALPVPKPPDHHQSRRRWLHSGQPRWSCGFSCLYCNLYMPALHRNACARLAGGHSEPRTLHHGGEVGRLDSEVLNLLHFRLHRDGSESLGDGGERLGAALVGNLDLGVRAQRDRFRAANEIDIARAHRAYGISSATTSARLSGCQVPAISCTTSPRNRTAVHTSA